MLRPALKAIIVGGGTGGLTAAVALRRVGLETVVFERASELRPVGAGISVWTNAMAALGALGLADAVRAAGHEGIGGTIRRWSGEVISEVPAGALEARFGRNVVLTRPDLQGVLLDALRDAGATLRTGARLVGFGEEGSGVVARFADGSEERGDFLVGADGLRSTVREKLWGDGPPRYAGFVTYRGLARPGFDHDGFEAWGRGRIFGLVPLGEGRFYWYATENAPGGRGAEDGARGGEKAGLLERFRGWHEPVPAMIRATAGAEILRNDVYDRGPLGRWGRGRVTLLGDAAHPMTPNLGQGACQAVEDAVELAACLRGLRRDDAAGALRRYEGRRRARTALVARRSRAIARAAQLESPLLRRLRDAVFGAMPLPLQLRQLGAVLSYEPPRL